MASEIIKNGQPIVHCTGSSEAVEQWVKRASQVTNTRLDWAYRGGYAIVYLLGDGEKRAIDVLRQTHKEYSLISFMRVNI